MQNKSLLKYLSSKSYLLVKLIGKAPFLKEEEEEEEWSVFLCQYHNFKRFQSLRDKIGSIFYLSFKFPFCLFVCVSFVINLDDKEVINKDGN